MPKTWFTSDTHFGHKMLIERGHRPFVSVEEMDQVMVDRWNERVSPGDTVFHLGDFAFAEHDPFLQRLRGMKRLILGNHDHSRRWKRATLWHTIDAMLHVTVEETPLALCHYAMRVWALSHYGALHLYGHSHGRLPGDSQSLDVGVDCWDFRPVSLEEIRDRLATFAPRSEPDHHVRPGGRA